MLRTSNYCEKKNELQLPAKLFLEFPPQTSAKSEEAGDSPKAPLRE